MFHFAAPGTNHEHLVLLPTQVERHVGETEGHETREMLRVVQGGWDQMAEVEVDSLLEGVKRNE